MRPLPAPTAVIADDERLMREQLVDRLKEVWPELLIVGGAANGGEAVAMVQSLGEMDVEGGGVTEDGEVWTPGLQRRINAEADLPAMLRAERKVEAGDGG